MRAFAYSLIAIYLFFSGVILLMASVVHTPWENTPAQIPPPIIVIPQTPPDDVPQKDLFYSAMWNFCSWIGGDYYKEDDDGTQHCYAGRDA